MYENHYNNISPLGVIKVLNSTQFLLENGDSELVYSEHSDHRVTQLSEKNVTDL